MSRRCRLRASVRNGEKEENVLLLLLLLYLGFMCFSARVTNAISFEPATDRMFAVRVSDECRRHRVSPARPILHRWSHDQPCWRFHWPLCYFRLTFLSWKQRTRGTRESRSARVLQLARFIRNPSMLVDKYCTDICRTLMMSWRTDARNNPAPSWDVSQLATSYVYHSLFI